MRARGVRNATTVVVLAAMAMLIAPPPAAAGMEEFFWWDHPAVGRQCGQWNNTGYTWAVQTAMWAGGNYGNYNGSNVDGVIGTNTTNAIKQYQAEEGLPQDGCVGYDVWSHMMSQLVYWSSGYCGLQVCRYYYHYVEPPNTAYASFSWGGGFPCWNANTPSIGWVRLYNTPPPNTDWCDYT